MDGDLRLLKKKINLNSIWINEKRLGICADWLIGSKVEDAWLSAQSLFYKIKKKPNL